MIVGLAAPTAYDLAREQTGVSKQARKERRRQEKAALMQPVRQPNQEPAHNILFSRTELVYLHSMILSYMEVCVCRWGVRFLRTVPAASTYAPCAHRLI
jgi:hypothetical protein